MTTTPWPADLLPPPWADGARPGIADLLRPLLPPSGAEPVRGRDVVVLLDGVGADLLEEHRALTPTVRAMRSTTERMRTTFPATTATALTTLTVGASPLETGVLGYQVLDPAGGEPVQQLTGRAGIDPAVWMPLRNLGQTTDRRVVQVGLAHHQSSHLTRVAHRDWLFSGHRRGDDRVDAVRLAVHRAGTDGLVYVHVAEADHAGHVHGVDSEPWREALAEADRLLGILLRRLPRGTRLTVTADHGMVDASPERTVDISRHPRIMDLVQHVAGESRALMLAAREGEELAARLRELLGEDAVVLERSALVGSGLFGPPDLTVPARTVERLPDVLVIPRSTVTVEDSSRRSVGAPRMVGVHGSLTPREAIVPVVRAEAG